MSLIVAFRIIILLAIDKHAGTLYLTCAGKSTTMNSLNRRTAFDVDLVFGWNEI